MNYEQALAYIHSTYKFGSKLGLENITCLLDLMGNPHKGMKIIHVAGTNGKGSTSSFIHSVLMEEGYKVGLYTSPYLEEFTERIRVNSKNIPKDELAEITTFVKEKVDEMIAQGKNHPTEFEVVTAIGFAYFKRQNVDFLVLEVGLGGRGDSTNVIDDPLVSVITPIDFDHMDYLGDTLEKIAHEKAGIIKKNGWVVSYPQQKSAMNVIQKVCEEQKAKLMVAPIEDIKIIKQDDTGQCFDSPYGSKLFKNIEISMLGEHQIQNAVMALTTLYVLEKEQGIRISKEAIYRGFKKANWPGRLEILRREPIVLIDGAHNVHGLSALSKVLEQFFKNKRIILGIGVLGDKDVTSMLEIIIPKVHSIILTKPNSPRAMNLEMLENMVKKYGKPVIVKEKIEFAVKEALSMAGKEDVVVFCGSLYMIGEVRTILKSSR